MGQTVERPAAGPVQADTGATTLEPSFEHLVHVKNLRTCFRTEDGLLTAVDGVSYHIDQGETLGLVGESGCGKSVSALSLMRLIQPPGYIAEGELLFCGQDLLGMSLAEMQQIRGNRISMVFQEPMTSLNPVYTIGDQISEPVFLHRGVGRQEAMDTAIEMLRLVGIPNPEKRVRDYPHQLSGGMRQRAMIAMALACRPQLLIADEPTTALDVTIQAQILELMKKLKAETGTSILLITHDLAVVAEMCDRVAVMYAGQMVEVADAVSLFDNPMHPYTRGLLASIPRLDQTRERLHAIPGVVPNPIKFPSGCRFHPRCPQATERCLVVNPPLRHIEGRQVACWAVEEGVSHV